MGYAIKNTLYKVKIQDIAPGIIIPVSFEYSLVAIDSTTTPLGGSATYTSASLVECDAYSNICGTCFADQAGTLYIQFSSDGTNVDAESSPIVYVASTLQGFTIPRIAPYTRLKFVNGAAAQATFRLYAWGDNS